MASTNSAVLASTYAISGAASSEFNHTSMAVFAPNLPLIKELNDKILTTSGANFARAYTVEFGTCKFPENFTGCPDLAKQKVLVDQKMPFLNDDLELESEGKDKYKCGSNDFWKW